MIYDDPKERILMDYGRRSCCICSHEVDTKSNNAIMLVTAWVKGNGKTVVRMERHEYKFAHSYCFEAKPDTDQLGLF